MACTKMMLDLSFINDLDVEHLSTTADQQTYLLQISNRYFKINTSAYFLISELKKSSDLAHVARNYSQLTGAQRTEEDVKELITDVLIPLWKKRDSIQESSFFYRKDLLTSTSLSPATRLLSYLFIPFIFFTLITLACLLILFFFQLPYKIQIVTLAVNGNVLLVFLLYFFSVFFHELGHASACKYYNIAHGNIGIGLYLHYPVFYADVNNAWRLKKNQRALVGFGGIYFQLLFCIPLIIFSSFIGNQIVYSVLCGILLNVAINLNPFFKFDGYWILSDLLGIPNLRKRSLGLLKDAYNTVVGQKTSNSFIHAMSNPYQIIIVLYVILLNIFFGYFFLYKFPVFVIHFFQNYLITSELLLTDITMSKLKFNSVFSWLMHTGVGLGLILVIYRMGQKIISTVKSIRKIKVED